ncbi:MAG: lamin tail domain-containing protein, partial [Sedimentisphaerales bacterium]
MKIFLFSLVIIVFSGGFAAAVPCPEGDLSNDCKVGWEDIRLFAEQWLNPGECEGDVCADFDDSNGVNFADFAFLANHWLEGVTTLFINEFMASNNSDSDINDLQGDFDDWIEIYNASDTPIDLAGMYLTDNLDDPTKWQIPSGYSSQTTVPADGFVVIWADDETTDGPLHANFKLSAGGEEIGLFDIDGSTPIDAIVFGNQTTNISYGRYPDAA